jgi:hypothetical protein
MTISNEPDLNTRLIILCCEGKTEKAYFEIIADTFRVHAVHTLHIIGGKGQHKVLIDRTVEEREKLANEYGIEHEEIVAWAVCDEDKMSMKYHDLQKYAESRSVRLAFSRPQFESYLLQHFEQSKETNQEALYQRLTAHGSKYGLTGEYEKEKGHLSWLNKAIFNDPHLVETAIVNSNQRNKQQSSPVLTVQKLPEFLKQFEPK